MRWVNPIVPRRIWPVLVPSCWCWCSPSCGPACGSTPPLRPKATIAGWREREAKVGRIYSCDRQTIGGYPFRIEVQCVDPGVELRRDDPPLALKAVDLLVVAEVFEPTVLVGEFTGPMTIAEPGQAPGYIANWSHGQSSVRGTPAAPERVSIVVDALAVDRVGRADPRRCWLPTASNSTVAWPRVRLPAIR